MLYKQYFKIYFLLFGISILLYTKTYGQLSKTDDKFNGFAQLSVNEGLSHSDANDIVQDNYGFLWIATNSGLNRYDGYEITTFAWDPTSKKGIPGNRILRLFSTPNKIWMLIEGKGLYYYHLLTETYHLVYEMTDVARDNHLIEQDDNGNFWIYSPRSKLVKIPFQQFNDSNIAKSDIVNFEKIESNQLNLKSIFSLKTKMYFLAEDNTVYTLNAKNKLVAYDTFSKSIPSLIFSKNAIAVFGNANEVLFWNSETKETSIQPITYLNKEDCVFSSVKMIEKGDAFYYLATNKGLFQVQLDLNNKTLVVKDKLIPGVDINVFYKDSFNIFWVACSAYGLFYKNQQKLPFGHIKQTNSNNNNTGLTDNFSSAILRPKQTDILWMGSKTGLSLYNIKTQRYEGVIPELENKHIRFLFQDSQGDIWVATSEDGAFRFRDKKLIEHLVYNKEPQLGLCSNSIVSISEDHLRNIWIASYDEGLNIYNKEQKTFDYLFHESYNEQSLGSNHLTYLYFHKNQKRMYISSRDAGITAVNHLDKKNKMYTHFSTESKSALSTNYTWSITSNGSDTLYVGTIGGGLNMILPNDKIKFVTKAKGLANNDIEAIELDAENNVWMGGRGISVYNPKTENISNFNVDDGLQSNSFKIGASFRDANGILYFGGVNGINYFNPKNIKKSAIKAKVAITGIQVFNNVIRINDTINGRVLLHSKIKHNSNITFKAKENEFSISFLPLNFDTPKKNQIQYKLEPYQKEWITTSYPNFKATYSNLSNGQYTFKLRASNKDNVWCNKETVLHIKVLTHWYKSNFALVLYALLIIGIIYAYNKYRANKLNVENQLEDTKKKQLLNQGKLDFFTRISHEIRTPLTLIAGPLDDLINGRETSRSKNEILQSMSRQTQRLISMTNKLLDFRKIDLGHEVIKASATKCNDFVYEIFLFYRERALTKNINYQFIGLKNDCIIYIDQEKIETVLINLLSNAFKFTTNNGKITVKLSIVGNANCSAVFNNKQEPIQNYLNVYVEDSGKGIPLSEREHIFEPFRQLKKDKNVSPWSLGSGLGLALVKSICVLHRCKIEAKSIPNTSTTFVIGIPLGKSYLTNDEIIELDTNEIEKSDVVLEPVFENNESVNQTEYHKVFNKEGEPKKRLLLVEDNIEVQQYINGFLGTYFNITIASNGKEGLEKARKNHPDIILSDVMMPVMDGLEMCLKIKSDDELHHIPVLLLTARSSTENELMGLDAGAEGYIKKPFNMDILLSHLATALRNRNYIIEHYSKNLHYKPKSIDNLSEDELLLQKIISLIETNLTNEKFNINSICSEVGMGRTKLFNKIKELTGKSIVEFVRDIRLKNAALLLKTTNQNVSQIAFSVGINDLKYFREQFKKTFNESPSSYRKNHAN